MGEAVSVTPPYGVWLREQEGKPFDGVAWQKMLQDMALDKAGRGPGVFTEGGICDE